MITYIEFMFSFSKIYFKALIDAIFVSIHTSFVLLQL